MHLSISHAIKVETKFLKFSMLSGQMTKFLLAEFGQVRQKISGSWPRNPDLTVLSQHIMTSSQMFSGQETWVLHDNSA